jgi:hypothetical protein
MNTTAKLNERLAFSAPAEWVPMDAYRQVIAVGTIPAVSPPGDVTVQLRKALDAGGTGPANLGTAVTAPTQAVAQAYASELGATEGGVPYTHVSAVITGPGSPIAETGDGDLVIRGDGRFNP